MTQPLSRYRQDARERIEAALASLPKDATRQDAEKAITSVSPYLGRFSGDGYSWASQCWARERKVALRRRFPEQRLKATPEAVGYELVTGLPSWKPWLRVKCGWCGGSGPPGYGIDGKAVLGGCLVCLGYCERVKQIVALPEFRALREDAARCPEVLGVLRDWLAEQGVDVGGDS